jgi:hypothetical protein
MNYLSENEELINKLINEHFYKLVAENKISLKCKLQRLRCNYVCPPAPGEQAGRRCQCRAAMVRGAEVLSRIRPVPVNKGLHTWAYQLGSADRPLSLGDCI